MTITSHSLNFLHCAVYSYIVLCFQHFTIILMIFNKYVRCILSENNTLKGTLSISGLTTKTRCLGTSDKENMNIHPNQLESFIIRMMFYYAYSRCY